MSVPFVGGCLHRRLYRRRSLVRNGLAALRLFESSIYFDERGGVLFSPAFEPRHFRAWPLRQADRRQPSTEWSRRYSRLRLLIVLQRHLLLRLLPARITGVHRDEVGVCERLDRRYRWQGTTPLGIRPAALQWLKPSGPHRLLGRRLGIGVLRGGSAGADIDVRRLLRRDGGRPLVGAGRRSRAQTRRRVDRDGRPGAQIECGRQPRRRHGHQLVERTPNMELPRFRAPCFEACSTSLV